MNKKIISIFLIVLIFTTLFTSTANAAASAKAFSSSKSSYYSDCGVYAKYGLEELGYTTTSIGGQITKSAILNWINNTGNGYAFYVHTLGGSGYFNDYNGNSIDSDDISGNWDLVYIDSSSSAKTNALASAFNTIGYSKRCFLGWSSSVTASNSTEFNYYFWTEYVGNATIQSCALSAASCVPGSGTTPIKLYGSTTYDGSAR